MTTEDQNNDFEQFFTTKPTKVFSNYSPTFTKLEDQKVVERTQSPPLTGEFADFEEITIPHAKQPKPLLLYEDGDSKVATYTFVKTNDTVIVTSPSEVSEKKRDNKESIIHSISPPVFLDEEILTPKRKVFEFFKKTKKTIFELEFEDCMTPLYTDDDFNISEDCQTQFQKDVETALNTTFEEFNTKVFTLAGYDRSRRQVVVFNQQFLIENTPEFPRRFYLFVLKFFSKIFKTDFVVVYINEALPLPYGVFAMLYTLLPLDYKNHLFKIYAFIPTNLQLKQQKYLAKDDLQKLCIVKDIYDFYKEVPVGSVSLPKTILDTICLDHPIFGIPLTEVVAHPFRGLSEVPLVIECAIMYFSSRVETISVEGIFRLTGSKMKIDQIIKDFNCGMFVRFNEDEDTHIVCSVLKTYLRMLPEPLLTYKIGETISNMFANGSENIDNIQLKPVLQLLPDVNRILLYNLVILCRVIGSHVDENKMSSSNLGIMLGPCIYWSEVTNVEAITKAKNVNAFFTYLLDNAEQLLEGH
ncbi:Rho GTPase-activating protein, putative [Entamoeba invadens IP1]|uniref:Rho GTPase-activating protein, putative n=1 Tax=Entamoeba invadens IP1 TaxID=370355 RepID=A0A0A1U6G0_ENTIV|nr:Rho GTPase-activating protein, putative [Entamoeba invadens IP1]ELP87391.1 Rho GTPase-activating protein, putative [Entamoeba invadens IP1]|eukprot:XP_004254162.1 Rho GTPase-activating protein, putative [Entamoeba invadens IP1]